MVVTASKSRIFSGSFETIDMVCFICFTLVVLNLLWNPIPNIDQEQNLWIKLCLPNYFNQKTLHAWIFVLGGVCCCDQLYSTRICTRIFICQPSDITMCKGICLGNVPFIHLHTQTVHNQYKPCINGLK